VIGGILDQQRPQGNASMRRTCSILAFSLLVLSAGAIAGGPNHERLVQRELAAEDRGDLRGAIDVCRDLLKTKPKDAVTMNVMAGLYGKLGQFDVELEWAQRAIDTDPGYHLAYVNLGNAKFSQGKHDEARAAFGKAAELAPADPLPVYSLGVVEEAEHHLLPAIALYEKSVKLDPKFVPGLFNLAAMYANARRYDDALSTLDRLLVIDPGAQAAIRMRARIVEEKRKTSR
jgi:tetratricopeptide (TPR) repeat protein